VLEAHRPERNVDEVFERRALEHVLERPRRRRMADDEDSRPVELGRETVEELAHALDHCR
jgi:hypothetical protein